MEYKIEEICGICLSEYIICPLEMECGHKFCMTCIYNNREQIITCPLCRQQCNKLKRNSPTLIFNNNIIYEKFYEDFIKKPITLINNRRDLIINNDIIIIRSKYHSNKEITENISIIGKYNNIIQENGNEIINIEKCYYIDRNMNQIYPTYPTQREFIMNNEDKILM